MTTLREQQADLVEKLRDAATAQDPIAQAAVRLVKLSVEELKESLVSADGEDMYRVQGAARNMSRLYRELTTVPPQMKKPGA